jgi:NAD-dependent dihydropyrimidine dehydrogenase PreA subunit
MANVGGTWYPAVFTDKCDGCAKFGKPRCVEFCPNGVLEFREGKAVVALPLKCVYLCRGCEPLCHKKAINFPKLGSESSLATLRDKGLIRKTVCEKCGKTFWTNRETDICMDCENKH